LTYNNKNWMTERQSRHSFKIKCILILEEKVGELSYIRLKIILL